MPTIGHVKLDAKDYVLKDVNNYSMTPANQMAVKLGTGAGNYDDLENWAAWLMDDWAAGAGQKRGDDPGFDFATADTRFGGQIILPPLAYNLCQPWDTATRFFPESYVSNTLIVDDTTSPYVAWKTLPAVANATQYGHNMAIMLWPLEEGTVVVLTPGYRNDGTGAFTWSASLTAITCNAYNGFYQLAGTTVAVPAGSTGYYKLQVTNGSIFLPTITTDQDSVLLTSANGTTWASSTANRYPWITRTTSTFTLASNTGMMLSWAGTVYFATHDRQLLSWTSSGGWTQLSAVHGVSGAMPCAMVVVDGVIWTAYTGSTTLYKWNIAGASTSNSVLSTTALWVKDYIYRADGNDLYYTADGTTWVSLGAVGANGSLIRDICNLAGETYIATDDGLYVLAPGEFIVPISEWPTRKLGTTNTATKIYPSNPIRMVNWQGSIYIAMANTLYRFDQGGSLINLSLTLNTALPTDWQGKIVSLGSSAFFLYAGVSTDSTNGTITDPDIDTGFSSVWAYNGQGWHCVMQLPRGVKPTTCPIEVETVGNRILVMTNSGIMTAELPDSLANPYEDARDLPFAPTSYIEFEWFDGGLREVRKDFESVYIAGEGFSATTFAYVLWKDDDSTAWELLGSVSANNTELRWSNSATRPNTKRLKLRIEPYNVGSNPYTSPRIDAIRVKYAPMVSDRWRWQFPIIVADNQVMMDGSLNVQTAAQMVTSLNGLIQRVAPFTFVDVDNTSYTVKVTSATKQVLEMEQLPSGTRIFTYIYNLTVEQVDSNL